ncbi:uncharacterized protein YegP (UPF0339 family) [Methylopila capsulata]|nr:DUF1508 domain-containing protein [Methylopila capsulata]MBM7852322.1 uncharacterized protein YegP (UPF0339 family) [Methylopila capsulata]
MATSFEDILAELPADRQERILRRSRSLMDDTSVLEATLAMEEDAERAALAGPLSFVIQKDSSGAFRFQLRAPNGEVLYASVTFAHKAAALDALTTFKRSVGAADLRLDVEWAGA